MRSKLCTGHVFHERFLPRSHRFTYSIYHLSLDLDEFDEGKLEGIIPRDKRGIFSIVTGDYLSHKVGSMRRRVELTLLDAGIQEMPSTIELITMPRLIGYVFNPVNFYFCRFADGNLQALVVEVSNTFGERHLYVLRGEDAPRFVFPKSFYVSPYFDLSGDYALLLGSSRDMPLDISVELHKEGKRVFIAALRERYSDLSKVSLFSASARMPFSILMTMIRIHFHALLIFLKKAAIIERWSQSHHPSTVHSHQTLVHRTRLSLLNFFHLIGRVYSPSDYSGQLNKDKHQ